MATPNYIQDPKKKKGIGDVNQVNRAADGTSSTNGTAPIDNTGTGANTDRLNTAVRGVVSSLGVNPDIQNIPVSQILQNTAQNIKEKGVLGSFAEGAARSARELATQSTNFGKAYIQGGKNVLFGSGGDVTPTTIPSTVTQPTPPKEAERVIAPSPSTFPSSATSGEVKLGQTPQGQLNIADQVGGIGTIQFADQRKLNQGQLDRLAGTIERNADPAFQQRLAQEAALSQSRFDAAAQSEAESNKAKELDFFKRSHLDALRRNDLVSVSQFANRIKELEGAGLSRDKFAAESADTSQRIGFESSKSRTQQALEAGKQQDAARKSLYDYFQADTANGQEGNPLARLQRSRQVLRDSLGKSDILAALGTGLSNRILEAGNDKEALADIFRGAGLDNDTATLVYNTINQ